MKKLLSASIFLVCCSVYAEMRLWEDKKGNYLEAEFVCETAGKIMLKGADGKEYKLSLSALSSKDQKFLESLLPPKLDINFTKSKDTRSRSYSSKDEMLQCEVTIKKATTRPYSGELSAEMVVVGKEYRTDYFVVLDKASTTFKLTKETGEIHAFKSSRVHLHVYDSSSSGKHGTEYHGFLVVVSDSHGNVIDIKASRDSFKENSDKLLKISVGSKFDKDCCPISSSRRFY